MKTVILFATIAACSLWGPIASAQDKAVPAAPTMAMSANQHMTQMQAAPVS